MKKFKVGDVVRFIDEAGRKDYPACFPPLGTVGEVTKLEGSKPEVYTVRWLSDDAKRLPITSSFVFAERLELVESGPNFSCGKILIMRDKKDPMRVIARDLGTNKTAEARCNPQDEFKFETGARLALDRLFGTEPTEKKDPPVKFKVGDVVIANEKARGLYSITRPGWIGYVLGVSDSGQSIKVAEKKGHMSYWVDCDAFALYRPIFRKGDRVRMRDPGNFTCSERSIWATDRIMTVKEYLPASDAYLMKENSYAFAPCWLVKAPEWNGRFTPVDSGLPWWTPGKIYEVEDGVVRDGSGDARYGSLDNPVESFAELQSRVPFKILEIKD